MKGIRRCLSYLLLTRQTASFHCNNMLLIAVACLHDAILPKADYMSKVSRLWYTSVKLSWWLADVGSRSPTPSMAGDVIFQAFLSCCC